MAEANRGYGVFLSTSVDTEKPLALKKGRWNMKTFQTTAYFSVLYYSVGSFTVLHVAHVEYAPSAGAHALFCNF